MVNKLQVKDDTHRVGTLLAVYVGVVAITLVALAGLSAAGSSAATTDAWVHAVIVAGFAVLLPLRWRAAAHSSRSAWRAVGMIAGVLLAVNVVEVLIPGMFPVWMRIEMVGIAVLMAGVVGLVLRNRR